MADIRIEKKKNNKPIWPWILGLVILLALGWGVFEAFDTDDIGMGSDPVVTQTETPVGTEDPAIEEPEAFAFEGQENTETTAEVDEFVTFVEEGGEMGLDHEYTSEGLTKLSAALDAVSEDAQVSDQKLNDKLETLRSKADYIQKNPYVLKHADSIKTAFSDAADAFSMLENEQANIRVENLERTVNEISPAEQTLNQKDKVKQFFDESANALKTLDENLQATEEEEV